MVDGSGSEIMSTLVHLSHDVNDAHGGAPPGPEHVGDEKVDAPGLHVTPLADADGAQDGHEDESDGRQHDEGRLADARLGHDPSWSEEDDDAKDVDEAGGEDAVPRAEEDAFRHQEVGQPPRRGSGTLENMKAIIVIWKMSRWTGPTLSFQTCGLDSGLLGHRGENTPAFLSK